jgi:hypothetical protein
MKKIITFLTIATLTVVFARPGGDEGKRQPPPEAISACTGQEVGTSCSIETPRGDTLEGTCQNTPDGKYFACKPNHHPKDNAKDKEQN